MSALIYGYVFVELSAGEQPLNMPAVYEHAREHAHAEVSRTGGALLIGPAQLISFHSLTRMSAHLVFPMIHEMSDPEYPCEGAEYGVCGGVPHTEACPS